MLPGDQNGTIDNRPADENEIEVSIRLSTLIGFFFNPLMREKKTLQKLSTFCIKNVRIIIS